MYVHAWVNRYVHRDMSIEIYKNIYVYIEKGRHFFIGVDTTTPKKCTYT